MPRRKVVRKSKPTQRGIKYGYRSGLEKVIQQDLAAKGVKFGYERAKVKFTQPAQNRTYTPDFDLPNGIIIESKGRFMPADRKKHLWVQKQNPDLEIRFVFSRAKAPINKGSKTTCAMWCEKHGFKWAEKKIPDAWIKEKPNQKWLKALAEFMK